MLTYADRLSTKFRNQKSTTSVNKNFDDKDYFCHKNNIVEFFKKVYPTFFEQFELSDFINKENRDYVYEGKFKNNYNKNKKYAFKIHIQKENKKKEENIFQEITIVKNFIINI